MSPEYSEADPLRTCPLTFPQGRFKLANLPGVPRRLLSGAGSPLSGSHAAKPLADTGSFSFNELIETFAYGRRPVLLQAGFNAGDRG